MQLVLTNPYRTLGLLVGASAREQERKVRRLKQYIEAEQEPEEDFSFPVLGDFHRTREMVSEASSKLSLDKDKLEAAFFWFYDGNAITDQPAFDCLKSADLHAAANIWNKLVSGNDVSQRNASAYQNLSTLILWRSVTNQINNLKLFERGLQLKLRYLDSDFSNDLVTIATDTNFKTSKSNNQLLFLTSLQSEILNLGGDSSKIMFDILSKLTFSAKTEYIHMFIQRPIQNVEQLIEEARIKRKTEKGRSAAIGVSLLDETVASMDMIKSALGTNDLTFASLSDKLSNEILQSGIDYFLFLKESDSDPSTEVMELFLKAKTLAIGTIAMQRCDENINGLREWISEKPLREQIARISVHLEAINELLQKFDSFDKTVAAGHDLLVNARPFLHEIKSSLGVQNEYYLAASSRIASEAQGACVSEVNTLQEQIMKALDQTVKVHFFLSLDAKLNQAWKVSDMIGEMDLVPEFRRHYLMNRESLAGLRSEVAQVKQGLRTNEQVHRPYETKADNACYIATMVYGDPEHTQVLHLRRFRDTVLASTLIGRCLVRIYYLFSPWLVVKLRHNKVVHRFLRYCLDGLIRRIGS